MLNVKKALTKIMGRLPSITVETVSTSSFNIATNNAVETTISIAKTGYTPLGIIGYNLTGSGVSFCCPYHLYSSGNTAYYAFRNNGNGQVSVTRLDLYVLYLKLGGVVNKLLRAISNLFREEVVVC